MSDKRVGVRHCEVCGECVYLFRPEHKCELTLSPAPAQEENREWWDTQNRELGTNCDADNASVPKADYQSLSAELERVKQERDDYKRGCEQKKRWLEAGEAVEARLLARAEAAELSNTALRGALEKIREILRMHE